MGKNKYIIKIYLRLRLSFSDRKLNQTVFNKTVIKIINFVSNEYSDTLEAIIACRK